MKYLYPYECEKRHLSTPQELQAAIDGNRREGRRSSYGQYDGVSRDSAPQMSPLTLASQQQQIAARMHSMMNSGLALHNGAHHPSHPQPLGQPINGNPMQALAPNDLEARMVEYMKMLNKEILGTSPRPPAPADGSPTHSPVMHPVDRMAFWNLYNSQPTPICPEPQREPMNLSEMSSSQGSTAVKREQESSTPPPPAKKVQKEDTPESATVRQQTTNMKISSRGKCNFFFVVTNGSTFL